MSMSDPIADFLTRIRNGVIAKHGEVLIPHSRLKEAITKVFCENKFIESHQVVEDSGRKSIWIKYSLREGKNVINNVVRASKAGRRVYTKAKDIKAVQRGFGCAVYSTCKGILTDRQAKKENVGGELICTIY